MNDVAPTDLVIRQARETARWQRRLLPFAIAAISAMAIFFFASSLIQLGRFNEDIRYRPDDRVPGAIMAAERSEPTLAADREHLRWKTLVLLEQAALNQRYSQVNSTLMLRAWTRHLGFLTGMILAFVGATFILAKLSESETRLSLEGTGAKGALATSSPGIVLATLGVALMLVTLMINFEFSTSDVPVYLPRAAAPAADGALPPPPPLDTPEQRQAAEQSLFGREEPDAPARSQP